MASRQAPPRDGGPPQCRPGGGRRGVSVAGGARPPARPPAARPPPAARACATGLVRLSPCGGGRLAAAPAGDIAPGASGTPFRRVGSRPTCFSIFHGVSGDIDWGWWARWLTSRRRSLSYQRPTSAGPARRHTRAGHSRATPPPPAGPMTNSTFRGGRDPTHWAVRDRHPPQSPHCVAVESVFFRVEPRPTASA